jgi:hypothetical protein
MKPYDIDALQSMMSSLLGTPLSKPSQMIPDLYRQAEAALRLGLRYEQDQPLRPKEGTP